MKPRPPFVVVIAGAVLGLVFSGFSTYDFASHLDRDVHGVHCSFLPGLSTPDATGASGCHATMMSPYSSMFRESVWGGIPISLPAMSVFAFLLFLTIEIVASRRQDDRRAAGFLALATALPAGTSLIMAVISLGVLGATCKLCVGIYLSSAACIAGGIWAWRQAGRGGERAQNLATAATVANMEAQRDPASDPAWASAGGGEAAEDPALASTITGSPSPVAEGASAAPETSRGQLAMAFAIGVAFVLIPVAAYATLAPDHSQFIGQCGVLEQSEDPYGIMVPLDQNPGGVPAIEVLDPLCPACRAFEERFTGTAYGSELNRRAVLFPLDKPCNWMIDEAEHPGACVVSQAVLCAGDRAPEVIAWAFAEQARIRKEAAAKGPKMAEQIVEARFPDLAQCVGSAKARSALNKSMRWAVQNHLQVLTPQLYIDGVKLCNEDVDIGLEYALSRMIKRQRAGTLRPASVPGAVEPADEPAAEPASAVPPPAEATATPPPAAAEPEANPGPAAETAADDEQPAPPAPASDPASDMGSTAPQDAATAPTASDPEPEPEPAPTPAPSADAGSKPATPQPQPGEDL